VNFSVFSFGIIHHDGSRHNVYLFCSFFIILLPPRTPHSLSMENLLHEISAKEQLLEQLGSKLQETKERMQMSEEELEKAKAEIATIMNNMLAESRVSTSSSTKAINSHTTRMQEEAQQRNLKRLLQEQVEENGSGDTELDVRTKFMQDIQEKSRIEREMHTLSKEIVTLKSKLNYEPSHIKAMKEEKKRREEMKAEGVEPARIQEYREPLPPPPKPLIFRSHQLRMMEEKQHRDLLKLQQGDQVIHESTSASPLPCT